MAKATSQNSKEQNLIHDCDVCKAPAPDHFHFGGRTCYSCRAFFRRTVERVQRKGLKRCKAGTGDCVVSQDAKSCIHCRYTKCINIGMKPELLKGKRKKDVQRRATVAEERDEIESDEEITSTSTELEQEKNNSQDQSALVLDKHADTASSLQATDVLHQTDLLLQKDPMYKTFQRFSQGGELTDLQVDELLKETLEKIEDKKGVWEMIDFFKVDKSQEEKEETGLGYCSVIRGPEMSLTIEERNRLDHLVSQQVTACKDCMPVSLFQARVGHFLGTLAMDEMMAVFSISRKAQNFWHYTTMSSMPGFHELTSRTQSQLIVENMQMCYSLTMCYYFFGHQSDTAVGQEEQTGILTGLGDFIRSQAPIAMSMPPAVYEDYYRSPWATTVEFEELHRKISKEIGVSLKDVGILGYIVIYSLTLYNVSEEKLKDWNTPDKDIKIINNVRNFLETIYVRLLRYKFGWKKATQKIFNQRYIMDQMNQVMLINTMENLQLNDFSNSQTINPLEEKSREEEDKTEDQSVPEMESEEESDYRRRDKFRSERQTCHQPGRPHYQPEPEWRRAGPPGPPSYKRPRHDFMERKPAQRSVETPVSEGYQPAKMTFKAFLSTQSDDITDEEAAFKYSEYKLEFRRQQLNEFFSCHKEAEWFRRKYHPEESSKRAEELLDRVKKRLEIFVELDREGRLDVSLQTDNEHALLRLLNTVVIKLEGGGEQHLKILDMDSAALAAREEENDQEAVKELHLTSSVFLPLLSPQVTHSELEEVCRKFPGYLRLSLSQPDQTKKWSRRAWVTFERKAKIKELCLRLNHVRLRGKELNPVVNKDLSKRIRSVPSLYSDQSIARNDLKIASKIITNLDNKNSLWINANNPVLSNVHDYLIDEVAAEEEELLRRPVDTAEAGDDPDSKRELEINKEILQVLDKLILYLRIVHSTDFYSSAQYPLEDEMPNRLGLLHVRERPEEEEMLNRAEVSRLSVSRDNKLTALSQATTALKGEEALKLGLKTESDEVEKFVSSNCQEISKDKWLCPLSGKKFKAPDFIRKHILNKFPEQVEKVKQETEFYNNYIRDPARPELPESPNKPVVQTQPKPTARPARNTEDFNDNEDTGDTQAGVNRFTTGRKRTIHERLGRTIRATHTVTDPRKIVDYSDVDIGGYAD